MTAPPYPRTPDGLPDMRRIPDWLLNHPELAKRGIVLQKPIQPVRMIIYLFTACSLLLRCFRDKFTVYQTQWKREGPIYVVKALKAGRPEADFYELFERYSDAPTDHTVPHELIRCEQSLVVMPRLSEIYKILTLQTSSIIAAFDQIMEVGVGY